MSIDQLAFFGPHDLAPGNRLGRLTINSAFKDGGFDVKCSCGSDLSLNLGQLRRTSSCGCLSKDYFVQINIRARAWAIDSTVDESTYMMEIARQSVWSIRRKLTSFKSVSWADIFDDCVSEAFIGISSKKSHIKERKTGYLIACGYRSAMSFIQSEIFKHEGDPNYYYRRTVEGDTFRNRANYWKSIFIHEVLPAKLPLWLKESCVALGYISAESPSKLDSVLKKTIESPRLKRVLRGYIRFNEFNDSTLPFQAKMILLLDKGARGGRSYVKESELVESVKSRSNSPIQIALKISRPGHGELAVSSAIRSFLQASETSFHAPKKARSYTLGGSMRNISLPIYAQKSCGLSRVDADWITGH